MSSSRKIIYVNSAQRDAGTDEDFSITLDIPLNTYDRVVLLQAAIPKSYYVVQAGSNTFTLNESTSHVTITVPPGNYTRRSLQTVLTQLLTTNSPHSWTYTIDYPNTTSEADTGKYAYSVSGNTSQPSFTFTTFMYEQLGFNSNSTNAFIANTLSSSNVIKLIPEDTLFIRSNICDNNGDNVLQEILTAGVSAFGIVEFFNHIPGSYAKKLTTNTNNYFHFYLTDENANILNLNGLNMVFSLLLYDSSKS